MDYQRGYLENLVCTEHGIQLLKGGQKGVFFSRVLDSGEKEMAWHRMTVQYQYLEQVSIFGSIQLKRMK